MRLALVTAAVMVAFAANSILNRLALADAAIGPAAFAAIRAASGAAVLAGLVLAQKGRLRLAGRDRAAGALSLTLYLLGFTYAYVALDAGAGALILFGWVQIVMFAGAYLRGEPFGARRWAGGLVAFAGLVLLLLPGAESEVGLAGAALMMLAATGWGVYSLVGRGARDPLGATAANFVLATPICLAVPFLIADGTAMTGWGIFLAILSGAVTSGLGYAVWYSVLPKLETTAAAVAQLTVPVIAVAGGMIFLSEDLTLRFAAAAVLVLGGVGISLVKRRG